MNKQSHFAAMCLWATLPLSFLTTASADFRGWDYSMRVSFTNYTDRGALTNFPVLVNLGDSIPGFSYRMLASPGGHDLRFTTVDARDELFYEIDDWNTNGESLVWVRVPVFTNNCAIRAWFGNREAQLPLYSTNGSVWSGGYAAVYHLGLPGAAAVADSTSNRQHFISHNVDPGDWVDGPVAVALSLNSDSMDEYLILQPFAGFPSEQITLAYWVMTAEPGLDGLFSYATTASYNDILIFNSPNIVFYRRDFVATGVAQNDGLWHHMAFAWRGSDGRLDVYRDGVSVCTTNLSAGTMITDGGSLVCGQDQDLIGGGFDENQAFTGILDEIRISKEVRSQDWVWAACMNVADHAKFNTYGRVIPRSPRSLLIVR